MEKIIIEITGPNKPPKVTIGGNEVKVRDISYDYETQSNINMGTHELLMTVANEGNNHLDKIGFES